MNSEIVVVPTWTTTTSVIESYSQQQKHQQEKQQVNIAWEPQAQKDPHLVEPKTDSAAKVTLSETCGNEIITDASVTTIIIGDNFAPTSEIVTATSCQPKPRITFNGGSSKNKNLNSKIRIKRASSANFSSNGSYKETEKVLSQDDVGIVTNNNNNNINDNNNVSKGKEKLSIKFHTSFDNSSKKNTNGSKGCKTVNNAVNCKQSDGDSASAIADKSCTLLPPIPDLIPIRRSNLSQMAAAVLAKTIFKASTLLNSVNIDNDDTHLTVDGSNEFSIRMPGPSKPIKIDHSPTRPERYPDVINLDTDNDSEISMTKSIVLVGDVKGKNTMEVMLSNQDSLSNASSPFLFSCSSPLTYNINYTSDSHDPEATNADVGFSRDGLSFEDNKGIRKDKNVEIYVQQEDIENLKTSNEIELKIEEQTSNIMDGCPAAESLPATDKAQLQVKKRGRRTKNSSNANEPCPKIEPTQEIVHRKSDRRRVAPDIYFVFEEHPANKNRNKKSKRPRGRPPTKSVKTTASKVLPTTRSQPQQVQPKIKTEILEHIIPEKPKLSIHEMSVNVDISSTSQNSVSNIEHSQNLLGGSHSEKAALSGKSGISLQKELQTNSSSSNSRIISEVSKGLIPRVNPIFLWVKQDDTRIVEVRCEDYDKRNRIRLTKTASGWRAIPRTDPTSSRVVKLLPNPMVHVKHEPNASKALNSCQFVQLPADEHGFHLAYHSEAEKHSKDNQSNESFSYQIEELKNNVKKSKKKKKKKKKHKKRKRLDEDGDDDSEGSKGVISPNEAEEDAPSVMLHNDRVNDAEDDVAKMLPQTPTDVIIYESTNHERSDEIDNTLPSKQYGSEKDDQDIQLLEQPAEPVAEAIIAEPTIGSDSEPPSHSGDLAKDLTQISQDMGLNIPFMQHLQNEKSICEPVMTLCSETGVFVTQNMISGGNSNSINTIVSSNSNGVNPHSDMMLNGGFDPSEVCQDADTKHLKELLDDDELLQHCDNTISGVELIDSLVKRGCEDHNISEESGLHHNNEHSGHELDQHISHHDLSHHLHHHHHHHQQLKNNLCLGNDFDNEDDELLLDQEPVEDIISRLGESLASSPKCLSFNEAGEIEALNGELFQTSNNSSDPFDHRHALEELSITIKDLEKSAEELVGIQHRENSQQQNLQQQPKQLADYEINNSNDQTVADSRVTRVSPDSSADELPKDLTCKKNAPLSKHQELDSQPDQIATQLLNDLMQEREKEPQTSQPSEQNQPPSISLPTPRSHSRSSDTIQSPQPSGLPAVPPSPDIIHSRNKNVFLDQLLGSTSISPKICSSVTVTAVTKPSIQSKQKSQQSISSQQKEPLDLGKHRKSASPTVSCSEEAKIVSQSAQLVITIDDDINIGEPLQKKIKKEPCNDKGQTESLLEMLTSGKDPDPLTQLRLLINNTEWKVPDPIVVPKDRLNAVLASPAREIPLLLTTRPELRLPEAFAYPQILQDPDILVISIQQLEKILQKQVAVPKPAKATPVVPHVTIEVVPKPKENEKRNQSNHQSRQQSHLSHSHVSRIEITSPSSKSANSSKSSTPKSTGLHSTPSIIGSGLANDIDSATLAAFNQMLWLPYLGQMAPELFKAMTGMSNAAALADILPFLAQQQSQQQQQQRQSFQSQFNPAAVNNAIGFSNPLEIAVWQEALNQAQLQRAFKLNAVATATVASSAQRDLQPGNKKNNADSKTTNNSSRNTFSNNDVNFNVAAFLAQKNASLMHSGIFDEGTKLHNQQQQQPNHSQTKSRCPTVGINPFIHDNTRNGQMKQMNANAEKLIANQRLQNAFYQHQSATNFTDYCANNATIGLRKMKNHQNLQQQQQQGGQCQQFMHNQQLTHQQSSTQLQLPNQSVEQKPRVTCKSLMNLLQPDRLMQQNADAKMSNLMALPSFEYNNTHLSQQQSAAYHHLSSMQSHHLANQFSHPMANSGNNIPSIYNMNQSGTGTNLIGPGKTQESSGSNSQNQAVQQGKLKVKPGVHLLDPAAMQRRLLNCDDIPEVGSTTSVLEEAMNDPNAALWHPLFGSNQLDDTNNDAASDSPSTPEPAVVNWKFCFICGSNNKTITHKVKGSTVKENLMKKLAYRTDPESEKLVAAIRNVDLVQVEACYHIKCLNKYKRNDYANIHPIGRNTEPVDTVMQFIYAYIDENYDRCQFSLSELRTLIPTEPRPHNKTILDRILNKYGKDNIIVHGTKSADGTILCFKITSEKLLHEAWKKQKLKSNPDDIKNTRKVAANIREKIRSTVCKTIDEYPPSTSFMDGAEEDVHELLMVFLNELILPGKRVPASWKTVITTIGHIIMKATRPRCFSSRVLLGLGCFLKKKFGSRHLIDCLAAIGLSSSYSEIKLLENCYVSMKQPSVLPDGFFQWVADNADFKINTLDGHNSWHVMAVIQCVTPSNSIEEAEAVPRNTHERRSIDAAEVGKIELIPYEEETYAGLSKIQILDLNELYPISTPTSPNFKDLLFVYGKWKCLPTIPSWNGFMEQVTEACPFETSKVLYHPFINAKPTEKTTVNTTLSYVLDAVANSGRKTPIITFDQQLFWIARDIAENSERYKDIFVRLGGFHLLMSFMGAIGKIMSGSGLEELWATIYAEGSIPQMLIGKSYARAVRAHLLTNLSIAKIILDSMDEEEETFDGTRNFLDDLLSNFDRTHVIDAVQEESSVRFSKMFERKLSEFESRGSTAKLWVQYYRMTCLLKQFLEAERSGNWPLYVSTIRRMVPFFYSSGHNNYAKSAHLYLQDIAMLQEKMTPQEFQNFTEKGFFTIRRSKKFFCGISADQTIEQTTMRLAKTQGGLTLPGRGITESETAKWTLSMYSLMNICEEFETFADVYGQTSEQHVDMRLSRVERDNKDVHKNITKHKKEKKTY